jgi:hypothetical protein
VTPEQAAHETRDAVVLVPSKFMFDAATFKRGAELGFEGFDFYAAGRGGALGDVSADVVVAAFVFFGPKVVHEAWARSAAVMPRRDAALEWNACLARWAHDHLGDVADWPRLADLLDRVVAAAPVAGAPVFAGYRALPTPAEPKPRALHLLDAIRELRGALHGAAVLTVGLTPVEAIAVLVPDMLPVLGWDEEAPDAAPLRERWNLAEARCDRMLGKHLAVLDENERQELVDTLKALPA